MCMGSKIGMRFYRVEARDAAQPDFAACLQKVASLSTDEERIRDISGAVIETASFRCSGALFWGDLLRHQSTDLPSLLLKGKPPAKLPLPADAALGHHTAFTYNPKSKMLGYQLSRGSVSMQRFNLYTAEVCECSAFLFVPVLSVRPETFRVI